jgi:hypothetical protein
MRGWLVAAALALLGWAGDAAGQAYRWADEHGNIHYAGRRDQVPERYRSQLSPGRRREEPRLRLAPAPRGAAVPGGCILRLRGTERHRGASYSYPHCDACQEARKALPPADAARAECFASSLDAYR